MFTECNSSITPQKYVLFVERLLIRKYIRIICFLLCIQID